MTAAAYGSRISARHARLYGATEECYDSNFKQQIHVRVLAARFARALRFVFPQTAGSSECRMRAAPAVSCARCTKENAHEHTGSAEAIRHSPAQWLYGLYRALPGDAFVLTPSSAD